MKRILIISSEFPPGPGGIGTHAFQIAKFLFASGWDVQVISPQDYASDTEITTFNAQQPFMVNRLPSYDHKFLQSLKRFLYILRVVRNFKPNLVMASGARAIWLSALLLRWRRTPWVIVGHGTEFGARTGLSAWITRFAGNRADKVICVSRYTQEALWDLGIVKPPNLVIHNGADHNSIFTLPKQEVAAFRKDMSGSDQFVLLTVGNVSDRKGQEVVIRAMPKIVEKFPNVQYWMAGIPQVQAKLEALSRELGVFENIRFWGRVSQEILVMLYNACDLFVMTSRRLSDGDFEGYGIAVIEAALCGKPAVVSDHSGLAEAVQHNQTGLLVPQNDPDQTADAILSLANNREKFRSLGQQAQENALENQTWARVGARYLAVFEEVLTGSDKGVP